MKLNRFSHFYSKKIKPKLCDHQGCEKEGTFRAPRNRKSLREFDPANFDHYYWFCDAHIKEYNANWNYYSGMNSFEIEDDRDRDLRWQRPSWKWGSKTAANKDWSTYDFSRFDRFGVFKNSTEEERSPSNDDPKAVFFPPNSDEAKALRVLTLRQPTTFEIVKTTYKEMAKRYHPDTNNGDTTDEDKLKRINQAYQILKTFFR